MAFFHSPRIPTNGLVHLLETTLFNGSSSQTLANTPPGSTWTIANFSNGTVANVLTLQSNVISDGSGNSYVDISRNAELETGSITAIIWLNMENIPLDVGGNNNWRGLLCTAQSGTNGSPLTMVMEQGYVVNFSTTHTSGYRRNLNGSLAPLGADANGWFMITYTYDQASGQAAAYKNTSVVQSGPMTAGGVGDNPTTAGTALSYSSYTNNGGFRVYGGTNSASNPNGNGFVPGELGNVLFYNRALSANEIAEVFNSYRTKYRV